MTIGQVDSPALAPGTWQHSGPGLVPWALSPGCRQASVSLTRGGYPFHFLRGRCTASYFTDRQFTNIRYGVGRDPGNFDEEKLRRSSTAQLSSGAVTIFTSASCHLPGQRAPLLRVAHASCLGGWEGPCEPSVLTHQPLPARSTPARRGTDAWLPDPEGLQSDRSGARLTLLPPESPDCMSVSCRHRAGPGAPFSSHRFPPAPR